MKRFYQLAFSLLFIVNISYSQTAIVAFQKDNPPYSYVNENGEAEGAVIDIYRLWADKTGFEVEFKPFGHNECVKQVQAGNADIVAGTYLATDTLGLVYSLNIIRLSTSLFLKEGITPETPFEIQDSIAILANSLANQFVKSKFPNLKLKEFSSFEDFVESFEQNKVHGFIYEFPDPVTSVYKMKIPKGYYRYYHLMTNELRPAVRKADTTLLQALIEGRTRMTVAEVKEISKKNNLYLGRNKNNWIYAAFSVLLVLSVLIIVLLRKRYKKAITEGDVVKDWHDIISKGENDKIEFKSSLRWDYRQEKVNKALELVIVKTISAFLNSDGGILFIGVDDDGNILGLQKDYETLRKQNSDGFLLAMTTLINQNLGKNYHSLLKFNLISINNLDVCILNIDKADKPVFVGKKGSEEFYVRASASSQALSMSEGLEYIRNHWPAK